MYPDKLIVNGRCYHYHERFLSTEQLWECWYATDNGEILLSRNRFGAVDSAMVTFDEKLDDAARSLRRTICNDFRMELLTEACPQWRSMSNEELYAVLVTGIEMKRELWGEYMRDDARYCLWRKKMANETGLCFTQVQYENLF